MQRSGFRESLKCEGFFLRRSVFFDLHKAACEEEGNRYAAATLELKRSCAADDAAFAYFQGHRTFFYYYLLRLLGQTPTPPALLLGMISPVKVKSHNHLI